MSEWDKRTPRQKAADCLRCVRTWTVSCRRYGSDGRLLRTLDCHKFAEGTDQSTYVGPKGGYFRLGNKTNAMRYFRMKGWTYEDADGDGLVRWLCPVCSKEGEE